MTSDPVDFVSVSLPGGGEWVRLDRLTDGRIMCQLCFDYFGRADLNEVEPGVVEDVCKPCAAEDAEMTRQKDAEESTEEPTP